MKTLANRYVISTLIAITLIVVTVLSLKPSPPPSRNIERICEILEANPAFLEAFPRDFNDRWDFEMRHKEAVIEVSLRFPHNIRQWRLDVRQGDNIIYYVNSKVDMKHFLELIDKMKIAKSEQLKKESDAYWAKANSIMAGL